MNKLPTPVSGEKALPLHFSYLAETSFEVSSAEHRLTGMLSWHLPLCHWMKPGSDFLLQCMTAVPGIQCCLTIILLSCTTPANSIYPLSGGAYSELVHFCLQCNASPGDLLHFSSGEPLKSWESFQSWHELLKWIHTTTQNAAFSHCMGNHVLLSVGKQKCAKFILIDYLQLQCCGRWYTDEYFYCSQTCTPGRKKMTINPCGYFWFVFFCFLLFWL